MRTYQAYLKWRAEMEKQYGVIVYGQKGGN